VIVASEVTMPTISRGYSKPLAVAAGVFFAAFLSIQLVRPELRSSPTADTSAGGPVKQILRKSCYDCHSNETRLEWFDQIAPVYWLVVEDVKQARHVLNFSDFDPLSAAQKKAVLFAAVNQIQLGAMPPNSYKLLHPESRITPEQLGILKQYLSARRRDHTLKPANH
jgi:hypothetical protein